jgi:fatty aldehyde-generating acyl-ACP reductase
MDNQSPGIKFAFIGHQDSWEKAQKFVNNIRITGNMQELSIDKIKEVYTYIPPRVLFELSFNSVRSGEIKGAYLECFIPPDELDMAHLQKNIGKVKATCYLADEIGVSIVSLGGFSSIVLESGNVALTKINNTNFTTGNTLTAAFIAKGVEKACEFWGLSSEDATLLIIGSTGDIGSACVSYFSGKVKKMILCARNTGPLKKQSFELSARGISNSFSTSIQEHIKDADIIISVASSIIAENDFDQLSDHTIVCDAGYPKNLQNKYLHNHDRYFLGGMGVAEKGYSSENDIHKSFYQFPLKNAVHGCLLESVVLAMDECYWAFSKGKGNITVSGMETILEMAKLHGIEPAPLFNSEEIIQAKTLTVDYGD